MPISRFLDVGDSEISFAGFIYRAIENDIIDVDVVISDGSKRLDHYAQEYYEDPDNWWVIAAASGIGWWLQIPSGVVLSIPTDLDQIEALRESII